jgi:cytochrome c biogenesis protein CcdA
MDESSSGNASILTVRQLYSEAQNWTRHYEALLVNAGVFIVTISLGFLAFAFSEKAGTFERYLAIGVPILLSSVGLALVRTLFKRYAISIERLIRYERILGCFDPVVGKALDGGEALLPDFLQRVPISQPPSVRFFYFVFALQIVTFVVLLIWRVAQ